ncbi:hypothetical protein Vretimale_7490 [Volvox reticuliferus]|uniref:Uncharacterized protein n=1 Tax=Volvox reticuliferus TaxID=1737510 RepID=A0A8J4CF28_9CHLO|nr:hypothetical protein Vretifemale_7520 [Volvox reticuliferus]GIM02614.1 hypothetical protein Vretimale_7490 [Volvox reticuliferus]
MELKNVSQGHQNARAAFRASIRTPVPVQPSRGRREVLQLGIALPLLAPMPAFADVLEAQTPGSDAAAAALSVPAAPKPAEVFLDLEFQVVPPASFKFVDTQPIYDPNRRGPAPEPSPVRARFDSPDGSTVLSVIVRNAQSIRPSILQVTDLSVFGGLEEAAKLLLPRGSRVLSASTLQVVLPPKQTALGPVELPPKNYYRYEFTTTSGLHVVMTAAAMKGKVFVCGGSTSAGTGWEKYGAVLREATESFHLRSDNLVL